MSRTRSRFLHRESAGLSPEASFWNNLGSTVAVRPFVTHLGGTSYSAVADHVIEDGGRMMLPHGWAGRTLEVYTHPGGTLLLSFSFTKDFITVTAVDPPNRAVLRCRADRFTLTAASTDVCPARQ